MRGRRVVLLQVDVFAGGKGDAGKRAFAPDTTDR